MSFRDPRAPFVTTLCALLCASCATVAPKVERLTPPIELLRECPSPEYDKTTNGGLANGLERFKAALGLCNADKAALREWSK